MPKPTFHNLPEAKRNRIIELALDEFSTHPYRQASLSRIVSRAEIAKGSMYQYFEHKLDLYEWLVTDELDRRRAAWMAANELGLTSKPANGLVAMVERMVVTQVGFMLEQPRLARLAASATEPTADAELAQLHSRLRRDQLDQLLAKVREAQVSGEVRRNLDARLLAHFIDAVVMRGTQNAVLDRLDRPGADYQQVEAEARVLVQQALDLIHHGIRHVVTDARPVGSVSARAGARPHAN